MKLFLLDEILHLVERSVQNSLIIFLKANNTNSLIAFSSVSVSPSLFRRSSISLPSWVKNCGMLTNCINSSITPLNGVIVGFCSSVRFISADEFCVRVNYAENCRNEKMRFLVYVRCSERQTRILNLVPTNGRAKAAQKLKRWGICGMESAPNFLLETF